ncbi:NTP transferase domain-containing protein [Isoptericola sp. 4D.3]|uniref:NTP transferase domain-containing protein n=1 Tax=Isoptericola peretonis TaxID=2918523 RepID=A0ABT0J8M4_9MICO|nr:NTP transferase domain-containing protein [Isoptericola sp. 4D.3]
MTGGDRIRYDAVVLAGGRATRLGGVPKPTVVLDGATLLDRALDATRDAGRTVAVGPDLAADGARGVLVAREDPPFGGPVAGLDAGLRALEAAAETDPAGAPWVLLLAVDVPRAGAAVPALCAAVAGAGGADGAYLVRDGRPQWLVGLYRREALRRALDVVRGPEGLAGVSVRRLVGPLSCVEVPDPDAVSADVDTWDDLRRLTVGLHGVVAHRAATPPAPSTDRRGGTR